MKQNPLTALREKLTAALQSIQQVNGFYTNAGLNVRGGWFEEIIQTEKASGPLIVIQRGRDETPIMDAGQLVLRPGYMLVAAVDAGFSGYEAALDDLEHDIYSALAQRGVRSVPWAAFKTYGMTFGEPLQAPPGGGTKWASLAIPINFKIIINRFDP